MILCNCFHDTPFTRHQQTPLVYRLHQLSILRKLSSLDICHLGADPLLQFRPCSSEASHTSISLCQNIFKSMNTITSNLYSSLFGQWGGKQMFQPYASIGEARFPPKTMELFQSIAAHFLHQIFSPRTTPTIQPFREILWILCAKNEERGQGVFLIFQQAGYFFWSKRWHSWLSWNTVHEMRLGWDGIGFEYYLLIS